MPLPIYQFVRLYALENGIKEYEKLFPITERQVQLHLQKVAEYLNYDRIGTHSFRKFFATEIYMNNNHDVVLVQQLLQHSSVATTQRYIGITSEMQERALMNHVQIL